MGGSGGGGYPIHYPPNAIEEWTQETDDAVDKSEHDHSVNAELAELLTQYNDRDVRLTRERLDEIVAVLEDALDATIDLRFGGSVAKHTFIDGLSDVDALVILRDREFASLTAGEVLDKFAEVLRTQLSYTVNVHEGQMAVTVSYPDQMDIQLLPAVQTATGFRIPASNWEGWSRVIRPDAFARKLTERNGECSNRLVPVIKIAKAALAGIDESYKPTGYHVESLAVEAFKDYDGPRNYKDMTQHFFRTASNLVLNPIVDSTGQSIHVDDNLGNPNSRQRRLLSGAMDRIAKRMTNADRVRSLERWLGAIGES